MSPATVALDARLADLAARGITDSRTALRRVERDLSRRVISDLVERDHVDAHAVRQLREIRRRHAVLPR